MFSSASMRSVLVSASTKSRAPSPTSQATKVPLTACRETAPPLMITAPGMSVAPSLATAASVWREKKGYLSKVMAAS